LTTEKYLDKSIGILAINEKKYQFIELLKIVNSHIDIQNKNILDVGSNTGIFMEFVKNKYKINKIVGIEPSLEASDYCIRNGLEIKNSAAVRIALDTRVHPVRDMFLGDVAE
jgi:predicted rRNA methylase YqxC with S4 and FtsJ domains